MIFNVNRYRRFVNWGFVFAIVMGMLPIAEAKAQSREDYQGIKLTDVEINKRIKLLEDQKTISLFGGGLGAVVAVVGVFHSMGKAQEKAQKEGGVVIEPNIIGLGVGLPLIGLGAYFYSSANREITKLRYLQLNPGYSQKEKMLYLALKLNF